MSYPRSRSRKTAFALFGSLGASLAKGVSIATLATGTLALTVVACKQSPANPNAIAQMVVLDQKATCPVTGRDIHDRVLEQTRSIGSQHNIKVTRIYRDTQSNLARKYYEFKKTSITPSIYFVDGNGNVVDSLHGNVDANQITTVINNHGGTSSSTNHNTAAPTPQQGN